MMEDLFGDLSQLIENNSKNISTPRTPNIHHVKGWQVLACPNCGSILTWETEKRPNRCKQCFQSIDYTIFDIKRK